MSLEGLITWKKRALSDSSYAAPLWSWFIHVCNSSLHNLTTSMLFKTVMPNTSNGSEVKRMRKALWEWEGGGSASARGYSKQIKSDFILRGPVAQSISRCLVLMSTRGPFMRAAQPISRLNEAVEKSVGQHINRKTALREYHLNKPIQANEWGFWKRVLNK